MVNKTKIINDIKSVFKNDNIIIDLFLDNIQVFDSPYKAAENSNIVSICTEWNEFKDLAWTKVYQLMKKPSWVFEGRNILNKNELEEIGFQTFFIGKS